MNIFVINLEKDISKKRHITEHFKEVGVSDYQFIPAIYGKTLTQDELNAVYSEEKATHDNKRPLTLGEIGCALSHVTCYQKIVQNNQAAFIFEDDCLLNGEAVNIMKSINDELHNSNKEIVTLLSLARYVQTRSEHFHINSENHKIKRVHQAAYTHAYYITPNAAKEMLEHFKVISRPIDSWGYIRKHSRIKILCVYPYCVSTDETAANQSSIAQDRIKHEQKNKSIFSRFAKFFREKIMKTYLQKVVSLITGIKAQHHTW